MIEHRIYAAPLYPGAFLSESGASIQLDGNWTARQVVDKFADTKSFKWFAIEVVEQNWKVWTTDEGDQEWRPMQDGSRKSWRIYIGELLTSAEVAALPGDHEILLRNMEYNNWDPIVRTRLGNFQPFEDGDVVFTEAQVAS